jgi:hypothetical protein
MIKNYDLIFEALKNKKKEKKEKKLDKNQPREFELAQLYNYLKSYIIAKFKTGEVLLRELKLNPDYFRVMLTTSKEQINVDYVMSTMGLALAKKFEVNVEDLSIVVTEIPNEENNVVIVIEYQKGEV